MAKAVCGQRRLQNKNVQTYMKKLIHSRTYWLAVAQAIGAVLVVALTELDMMGAVLAVKSAVDILLRLDTRDPVV